MIDNDNSMLVGIGMLFVSVVIISIVVSDSINETNTLCKSKGYEGGTINLNRYGYVSCFNYSTQPTDQPSGLIYSWVKK